MSEDVLEVIDGGVAVRCRSTTCDKPGGRVIFSTSSEGLIGVRWRGTGVVAIGIPVMMTCRCGWSWRSESLDALLDQFQRLEDS